MPSTAPSRGIAMVLAAAMLWGAGGLFIFKLLDFGLSPFQVVYYANAFSLVIFVAWLLVTAPGYLRVPWRALPELAFVALLSSGVTFILYTLAIQLTGVSLAILLNYTAPAWVTLLAWRVLGEPVGRGRLVALAVALAGCALLVRVYNPEVLSLSWLGIAVGLASGLGWALYQVFGKRVLDTHHPLTLSVYACVTAVLVTLPFQPAPLSVQLPPAAWPWLAAFVLGPSVLGPVLFNWGLRSLPAGVVSLLAMGELLVGVLLGVLVLGEALEAPQVAGAVLLGLSVLSLRPSAPIDQIAPASS